MKNLKLIDGTFSPQETKEVLVNLIDDKIRFHKCRIFSHEERFGSRDEYSDQRVMELQLARKELIERLDEMPADAELNIDSTITINITANTPV